MTKARDLASATPVPSAVSATELGYLDGVTSAVQTQINAKTAVAKGSTASRPTGSQGDLYYDTTVDNLYQKNAYGWEKAGTPFQLVVDALVIAGGGGGGAWISGGGGAGGVAYDDQRVLALGTAITVTVGAGGAGALNTANDGLGSPYHVGGIGGDSYFDVVRAYGGGGGGGNGTGATNGVNGGSGGGAAQGATYGSATQTSNNGSVGYGNRGGIATSYSNWTGSGGGGAGAVGGAISGSTGGSGGVGMSDWSTWGAALSLGHNVSGTRYFAGGGGGSGTGTNGTGGNGGGGTGGDGAAATAGTTNTGGGGGGQVNASTTAPNGGSGVVMLRFASSLPSPSTISGGLTYSTVTTGGYKYYAFTAGTGTVTW